MFVYENQGVRSSGYPDYSNLTDSLFQAAESNDPQGVNFFHIKGGDINARNSYGETLLHVAVSKDSLSVVEFILFNELLNPNVESNSGEPPIFLTKSVRMLKLLVSRGASIDVTNSGQIPLMHYAASKGRYKIVDALVKVFMEDINQPDSEGRTPLHFAAAFDHTDTVDVLLQIGADVDAQTNQQYTPLHYAAIGEHETTNTADLLLGPYGNAHYNIKNCNGKTALELAITCSKENRLNRVAKSIIYIQKMNVAQVKRSRKKLRASNSFPLPKPSRKLREKSPLAISASNAEKR
ncbi:MAG: hypothetical protein ChlgKO_09470 [Chlamydiales bacterium]